MASQPIPDSEADMVLFAVAAKVAREKGQLHKGEIAARAGMTTRMLHRLTTGTTRATERSAIAFSEPATFLP